jgi:hypothetical protein
VNNVDVFDLGKEEYCTDCRKSKDCREDFKRTNLSVTEGTGYLYAFCRRYESEYLYNRIFVEKKLEGAYWRGIPIPIAEVKNMKPIKEVIDLCKEWIGLGIDSFEGFNLKDLLKELYKKHNYL